VSAVGAGLVSGWVAIPQAAIVAAGREGRSAVLDLYDQADRSGYAPRLYTEQRLAEEWGVTRDRVRHLLRALEVAGCIEVEKSAPGARVASVLRVLPVVGNQGRNQGRNQTDNQTSGRETPTMEQRQPEPQPGMQPGMQPSCAEESRASDRPDQTRPDQTREEQHTVGPPALAPTPDRYDEVALFFGEVVHRQLGRRPSKGPARASKLGQRLLSAVRKDADLVLDAMRFVAHSETSRAQFLRGERADATTIETILRHVDEYAEGWREYGDQSIARIRAGPAQAPRSAAGGTSTVGDGVLQRLWDRVKEAEDGYE
jgi:hypothetical protein